MIRVLCKFIQVAGLPGHKLLAGLVIQNLGQVEMKGTGPLDH